MPSMKINVIESIWKTLPGLEQASRESLDLSLKPWEDLVACCIEAGALAPMVPTTKSGDLQLITAGPFLKCTLDDLRAVWILVERGYTSQAAAVAAAIFENALTAAVVAGSKELALQAQKGKYAQIPWGAKELCQLDAKREMRLAEERGEKKTVKMYEDNWTISYFHYKWLCQVKHPTWQAAIHAIHSTAVADREYAVRPGPNNLPQDIQVKARVLAVSLTKALQAIKSFFITLDGDENSEEYKAFEEKINKVHFGVLELIKLQYGKASPIQVLDRSFIKTDFSTLREKYGE
jgi:hypothetical protein